jgi:hypothetical protein
LREIIKKGCSSSGFLRPKPLNDFRRVLKDLREGLSISDLGLRIFEWKRIRFSNLGLGTI